MIKKFSIFSTIVLIVTNTIANTNTVELSLISSSVSKHPEVVEKANEITLKGISLDQILAENGLQISISTKSKLPISYRLNDNKTRVDDLDRTFLDGIISAQKTLYDFGKTDYKVSAEKSRKKSLELEYVHVYETILQKLLKTVNDIDSINTVLDNLEISISLVKASIDEIKLRFTSGIGTVMDVRQAQLMLLDLETETQNLHREYNIKLATLRDEFGISKSDLSMINIAIIQFNNELTVNKQDIGSVIFNAIDYQRSKQIIDLEKTALNSQIKSLKSENMPHLSASITGVAYDVTRGLDEFELYGGINLTMPLFDSGLNAVKQRSLAYRIKVQNDLIFALNQDKSLALNKLTKSYQNVKIEHNSSQQKQSNLSEKLDQIIQRMSVVDESLLTKLQTQLQLAKSKRNLLAYPYQMQSLNIDYWALNEQLLQKINIRPVK
jgi:outer membrane protein TolC